MQDPRDRVNYDPRKAVRGKDGKLRPFTARQVEPWYSMNRPRNMIALSVLLTLPIFAKPIFDVFTAMKNSIRMHYITKDFNAQLDREEAEDLANADPKK